MLRVIGDRQVFVAGVFGGLSHFTKVALAVGRPRVDVKIALDVRKGDELRQLVLGGRLDFTVVLAKLGLDVGQVCDLEDLLFRSAADPPVAAKDSVLVDFQSLRLRDPSDGDVVVFRAGEIVEGRAVARLRNDAEVDLDPSAKNDRRARRTLGGHFCHFVVLDEVLDGSRALPGRDQDVEISDRFLPAPETPRNDNLANSWQRFQIVREAGGEIFGGRYLEALLRLSALADFFEKLRLHRRPEPRELAELSGLGGFCYIIY